MRLQTLEMKGFKSFADHQTINFSEDVIGIVGPNGCGKSNIVDAMRWVLGEHKSKELRLDKMTSVIFNGAKNRKQGGMAEVSLTFENTKNILPTEYNTVKISRILYRSGESEYRLNGVTCRRKDILTLLMDTGIGSNSYAIIALGMVDDILQDREGSRRKLIEQAAGVSKYKVRKRETLNKLKHTSEDLDRVEDLLYEIEGNLKTLERQAKRAKKYFEIKAKYKQLSIELAVHKLSNYKDAYKSVQDKIQKEQDNLRQLDIDARQFEVALEKEKKANLDKEKLLSEQQRELNSIVGRLRGLENDKRVIEQKELFLKDNKSKLHQQIQQSEGRLQDLRTQTEMFREDINAEKRVEARLEMELNDLEDNLTKVRASHTDMKAEMESFVQKQQELDKAIFELEKQKAIKSNQVENLRKDVERRKEEIDNRKEEFEALDLQCKTLSEQVSQKEKEIAALEVKENKRQADLEVLEKELDNLQKETNTFNRQLDAKRNEQKLTKSMVDNLEGFSESIKFLNKNKDWKAEATLLSDVLYTPEEFRVAIENYLEPYLSHYIVKNEKDAVDAIRLLNKTQRGKANFFILSAFHDYEPPIIMQAGVVKATDVVTVDGPYKKLLAYLLGNVMFTDDENLENAVEDPNLVFLSKSGRFIKRKFTISGGSVGLFEGKRIGRKKNLEMLNSEISKLQKKADKTNEQFHKVKQHIQELKANNQSTVIQAGRRALNQLSQQLIGAQTKLEGFSNFNTSTLEKINAAKAHIATLDGDLSTIEQSLSLQRIDAEEAKVFLSKTDGSFRSVAEQLNTASSAFNEKNIQFIRQQNKVSTIQKELSFKDNQIGDIDRKLKIDRDSLGNADTEILQAQNKLDQIEKELVDLYAKKKAKSTDLTDVEQLYYQSRGGINELEDKVRATNRKKTDAQQLFGQLKDKFNDLKMSLTQIGERLKVEFGISVNDIINNDPNPEFEKDSLEIQVNKLKTRLDNYGEVNPMAVEAYDEMKERYDTISGQRNDILEAKKTLEDTIKEIETTATAQFLTSFENVRTNFKDVFQTLFNEGDDCDIVLENPDDPLESKIKITAKPKGKRPQSISQLSGGEKTLTATALLFSLYLLKPAPFCIFDEVDAPLDDANIGKFNKIVRKFSADSQFIIVTHNKETMAAVDSVYGVTQNDPGVSIVVPTDFQSLEHRSIA